MKDLQEELKKEYQKIPSFTPDTCKNCKGHGVEMLDNTYETSEDRELLVKVLNNYITNK